MPEREPENELEESIYSHPDWENADGEHEEESEGSLDNEGGEVQSGEGAPSRESAPVSQTGAVSGGRDKGKAALIKESVLNGEVLLALNSFDMDLKATETGKEASDTHAELKDALQALRSMVLGNEERSASEVTAAVLRLSEAADAYRRQHHFLFQFRSSSRKRRNIAKQIRAYTTTLFESLSKITGGGRENAENAGAVAGELSKEELKALKKRIEKLPGHYRNWSKVMSDQYNLDTPEAKLKKRYLVLRAYEKDIAAYRANVPEKDISPEIKEVLDEADNVFRMAAVTKWATENDGKSEDENGELTSFIKEHVASVTEAGESAPLDAKEMDIGLDPAREAGITAIDQWLVRNYNNGGVFFTLLGFTNRGEQFVTKILSKTKREKLFIYYLVEKDARKNPSAFAVAESQFNYTPNLDAFKDKMLATKWKFLTRATGGYVYMNKLSEAADIAGEYREDLLASAAAAVGKDKGGNGAEGSENAENPGALLQQDPRFALMRQLYDKLDEYRKTAENAQGIPEGEKKEQAEAEARELADEAQALLDSLVVLDKEAGDKKRIGESHELDRLKDQGAYTGYVFSGAKQVDKLGKIGLDRLEGFKVGAGSAATAIAGAGQLAAAFFSVMTLVTQGSSMSWSEFFTGIGSVFDSVVNAGATLYKGTMTTVAIAEGVTDAAQTVSSSPGAMIAGGVAAGVSFGINFTRAIQGQIRMGQAKSAGDYFERRRQEREEERRRQGKTDEQLTEEEKKQRRKEQYESNMSVLAQDLARKNRTTSAIKAVGNAATMVGVFIPGVGTVMALVGTGVALIGTIMSIVTQSISINEAMFDKYYHTDDVLEEVCNRKPALKKKNQRLLKKNLRRYIAAADNSASVPKACLKIAGIYARQIYSIIFDPDVDMEEKEAYISLLNSLGLTVNEDKREPGVEMIMRKLSGR